MMMVACAAGGLCEMLGFPQAKVSGDRQHKQNGNRSVKERGDDDEQQQQQQQPFVGGCDSGDFATRSARVAGEAGLAGSTTLARLDASNSSWLELRCC